MRSLVAVIGDPGAAERQDDAVDVARQAAGHIVIVVQADAELLEVVAALRPPGRLASGLHRRQEQGDQNADDGNDDEQLDEREAAAPRYGERAAHGENL